MKTFGINPAGVQGEIQSSLLCLVRQAAICTAGQMFMVLRKGSISGKVDHSCWGVYGRWLCYSTKLVFPSVGWNGITRGSNQAEGRLKGRLPAPREKIIYQFFSRTERDVGLCPSACSVHQLSYRQREALSEKQKEIANKKQKEMAKRKRWQIKSLKISKKEIWTSEQKTEPLSQK